MINHAYLATWQKRVCARNFATLLLLFAIGSIAFSQVPTVVLNGKPISDFIPFHTEVSPEPLFLPKPDIEAALAADAQAGIEIPRFGVKIPAFIGKNDGTVEIYGASLIWKKSFYSSKAKSLNFEFADLRLPENAQMYIYNSTETMFAGPVESKHVFDGQYASDVIRGDLVTIEISMNIDDYDAFSIMITNVIHGFVHIGKQLDATADDRAFGDSGACNEDVNCTNGLGRENQRDAVALVITDNSGTCSGALLNDQCQDLRSFFLTAFHCLPSSSGFLNWTFRFNYDSPNPVAPACQGDEPTTWLTYSGATIRAASSPSDFGLLELSGSIIDQPTLALAGWDRNLAPVMPSVFGIHHPAGDVKKISTDNTTPTSSNSPFLEWFVVNWTTGSTEGGSSGSPLFTPNGRIVGQDHRGNGFLPCNPSKGTFYGRFDASWTGPPGATNSTRLSNWLGLVGAPMTTNTIRSPFITGGSNPLCGTNTTFVLNNPVPGRAVTWSVTPSNLFAVGAGASTSGTGTSATIRPLVVSAGGDAVLTYTLAGGAGCGPVTVTRSFWAGKPNPQTAPTGAPTPINIVVGQTLPVYLVSPNGQANPMAATWTKGSALSMPSGPAAFKNFTALSTSGSNFFTVTTSNTCGTSMKLGFFNISPFFAGGGGSLKLSPNPSKETVLVSLTGLSPNAKNQINTGDFSNGSITVFNMLGRPVLSEALRAENQELDISSLPTNVYLIEVSLGNERLREKLLVIE